MSTYLYQTKRYGRGDLFAKVSDGYIYDGSGYNADVIGKVSKGYLYKYVGRSLECTEYCVEGNILYKKSVTSKEAILIAKNSIICRYDSFSSSMVLAEYEGSASEALFAYAAIKFIERYSSSSNYINSSSSGDSNNLASSSSSSGGGGDWIPIVIGGASFFIIPILIMIYEYYTFLHVGIPALVIIGILIKRANSGATYEYEFSEVIEQAFMWGVIGFVVLLVVGCIDMGVFRHLSLDRNIIISFDTAYIIFLIEFVIIGILLSANKKD